MHQFKRDSDTAGEAGAGIDWPQAFVALGVVGVAAWGLWFFLRDRERAAVSPATSAPLPRLPVLSKSSPTFNPNANVPGLARVEPAVTPEPAPPPPIPLAPAAPVFLVGDPLMLRGGQHYRAKLHLSGLQATFATRDLVQAQFLSNGFSDVIAYKSASNLPADWPAETAQGGSGVWWVEGNWARGSGPVPRQPQVTQVWEA
jgi:hypothetical protein